nr:MmpS family transport accessory protein [Mycobacterium noviomagense]
MLAVIATALILYGGDSTSTTATVGPPPTRHVIATPPPSIPTAAPPTSLPRETVTTLTPSAAPTTAPSPVPTVEPSPSSEASPPAVNPRTIVYSVTGTKQPFFDLVTVIYTDAQGLPQTDFDVSLPWSKTIVLNPGVQTKSVIATSLAGHLNCAINDAAGQTIAASTSNAMIATCAR